MVAEDKKHGLCQSSHPYPSSLLFHSNLCPERLTSKECLIYVFSGFRLYLANWKLKQGQNTYSSGTSRHISTQVGCILLPNAVAPCRQPSSILFSLLFWKLLSTLFLNRIPAIVSFRALQCLLKCFLNSFYTLKKLIPY